VKATSYSPGVVVPLAAILRQACFYPTSTLTPDGGKVENLPSFREIDPSLPNPP
jgi:hypothetical protein